MAGTAPPITLAPLPRLQLTQQRPVLPCRVDGPANLVDPEFMAEQARSIASDAGPRMEVSVLGAARCRELGMGAYLGVAAASALPPQ
jgi:hypothetical protein